MAGPQQLYIVRIQCEPDAFLATARRADEETSKQFAQPQALLDYLLATPVVPAPAADPSNQGDDDEPL